MQGAQIAATSAWTILEAPNASLLLRVLELRTTPATFLPFRHSSRTQPHHGDTKVQARIVNQPSPSPPPTSPRPSKSREQELLLLKQN